MRVLNVEVLSKEAAASLSRQARRESREARRRNENMTSSDLQRLLWKDISSFRLRSFLIQDSAPVKSPLPHVTKHEVGKYERPEAIRLLRFVQSHESEPVLVESIRSPSKAFEESLRHSAKVRNIRLHITRLTEGWTIIEGKLSEATEQWDRNFLKSISVRW